MSAPWCDPEGGPGGVPCGRLGKVHGRSARFQGSARQGEAFEGVGVAFLGGNVSVE